jgi:Predicted membrane protein (DUF2142)
MVLILLVLWMEIIPPNGSPDERSHFVRLGGISSGHPFGNPPVAAPPDFDALTPAQRERVRREAGIFHVGANYLYISGGDCNSFYSDVPACAAPLPQPDSPTAISEHAHSQIAGYVLPAVLSRLGWSGRSTFYLARLGIALMSVLVLLCGFVSVRRAVPDVDIAFLAAGGALSIAPLVAFLGGALAPAIIGTFGAIALCMCTWAIVKLPGAGLVDRGLWLAAFTAACCSASAGVAYAALAIMAGLVAAWCSPKRLLRLLGIAGVVIGVVVATCSVLWDLIWKVNLPATEPTRSISTWTHNFSVVWNTSRDLADQLGWLDVSMPMIVKLISAGLIAWWIVRTSMFDSWRWVAWVAGLACVYFAIGMALAHSIAPTGFSTQARYFLPGICIFPVAAALRLSRLPPDMRNSVLPGLTLGLWGFGMTCAAYALLRRHVVGAKGPIWFFGHGAFRPLGGWLLAVITLVAYWIALALLVTCTRAPREPTPG